MSVVDVVWKGNCRSAEARYRLLDYLHRLAVRSEDYLRIRESPVRDAARAAQAQPLRPNIEVFDDLRRGPIFVSSSIGPHPDILVTRALEAGLRVECAGDGESIVLEEIRLRGLEFKLFDPRAHDPDHDRMSFVFMECPEHHFLDGRLVEVKTAGAKVHLSSAHVRLDSYLEDWTDCLFSWIRFFLMGDFWWRRREELQGYTDYRSVFEELQTSCGCMEAEDATFDAVLSTFSQHAEHRIGEVQLPGKLGAV